MAAPIKLNLKIYQGSTFKQVLRWESSTKVYVPITGISKAAPCVITTSEHHNLPTGWRFRVSNVAGMKEINSVGEDAYYMYTGPNPITDQLQATWEESELLYQDARTIDAATIAPITRPWANMTGYDAYVEIQNEIALGELTPTPALINLRTLAKQARDNYTAWQESISGTDTITVNQLNSLGFTAYTSNGVIEYNKPAPITNLAARMQIREKLTSETVIHELTTENGGIVFDNTYKTISLNISAATTTAFNFTNAVYLLEFVNTVTNEVTPFARGSISLDKEVTR